jgi:hypothetical protein
VNTGGGRPIPNSSGAGRTARGHPPPSVSGDLPGDQAFPPLRCAGLVAITIGVPPKEVWPRLLQVGYDKAGFYSNDLLDRLGRPSADALHREWQNAWVGEWVARPPIRPRRRPSNRGLRSATLVAVEKPDSTWNWRPTPSGEGRTRQVTRLQVHYDWSRPTSALLSVVLIDHCDYAMIRRMLPGLKKRAERHGA